jgi:hypothetical protein
LRGRRESYPPTSGAERASHIEVDVRLHRCEDLQGVGVSAASSPIACGVSGQIEDEAGDRMDTYTRHVRLYPVYLLFLPIALPIVALSWAPASWLGRLVGLAVACGLPLLAAQVGRSAGKREEQALYAAWGGPPTTAMLRHRASSNSVALARRHKLIGRAIGIRLPSAAEEDADPDKADAVYETAVAALRERTRNADEFPLVFDEVCNYGFRRNLWGHRTLGIVLAAAGALIALGAAVLGVLGVVQVSVPTALVVAILDIADAVVWARMVTENWVRQAADAYAERLLSSAERLTNSMT